MVANLGLTAGTYNAPALQQSAHTSVPSWKPTQTPRPSGSVWVKTTSANSGANWVVKVYNSTTEQWNVVAAPVYNGDSAANAALDPNGGGLNIAKGSMYVCTDPLRNTPVVAEFTLHYRAVAGATVITATNSDPTITAGSFTKIGRAHV